MEDITKSFTRKITVEGRVVARLRVVHFNYAAALCPHSKSRDEDESDKICISLCGSTRVFLDAEYLIPLNISELLCIVGPRCKLCTGSYHVI
jgi:hypothetical protein